MFQQENEFSPQSTGEVSKPVKVMLADDDSEDQELFQDALQRTGANTELTVVSNGQELVDNLKDPRQENPDIIFLDINMPIKDGKQALKEIKKDQELKEIPAVMLSTSNDPREIKDAFDSGAALYVIKPHSFKNFVLLLKKVFSFHWAGLLLKPIWKRFFFTEKNVTEENP
jgi:CheY-like chemotaxis protein